MSVILILLRNINDITSYHRNIQTLMIESFKIKHDLAPLIMDSMLNWRTVSLTSEICKFQTGRQRMVFYGLETIS